MLNFSRLIFFVLLFGVLILTDASINIVDSDEKSYLYIQQNETYLHLARVPDMVITRPEDQVSSIMVYNEEDAQCKNSFFNLTLDGGNKKMNIIHIKGVNDVNFESIVNGNEFVILGLFNRFATFGFSFSMLKLHVFDKPEWFCNVWLRMSHDLVIKRLPPYPKYTAPSDTSLYVLPSEALSYSQINQQANGLNLFIAQMPSDIIYTFYKGSDRPIQTMELSFTDCKNLTLGLVFNEQCNIDIQRNNNDYNITVGGIVNMFNPSPGRLFLTFTLTDVYAHTISPLGIRHLGKCDFGPKHKENTEFAMRVLYDKQSRCDAFKAIFVDEIAIKRPPPTTTTSTTTTTTTTSYNTTEGAMIEDSTAASVAKAKSSAWIAAVVVPIILLILIAACIGGTTFYCCKKKKQKPVVNNPNHSISTVENDISANQTLMDGPSNEVPNPPPPPPPPPPVQPPKAPEPPPKSQLVVAKLPSKEVVPAVVPAAEPADAQNKKTKSVSVDDKKESAPLLPKVFSPLLGLPDPYAYDYHAGEPEKFGPVNMTPQNVKYVQTLFFINFWESIASFADVMNYAQVYAFLRRDSHYEDIYFWVRDLVLKKEEVFNLLANRILEPGSALPLTLNNEERFAFRLFITTYTPLTLEIHMTNKLPYKHLPALVPQITNCIRCNRVQREMVRGQIFNAVSYEDWPVIMCRLKRIPINHHYFVSLIDPNDETIIHHMIFIRGQGDAAYVKPCRRNCDNDPSIYHKNDFPLISRRQVGVFPTSHYAVRTCDFDVKTEKTQPSV